MPKIKNGRLDQYGAEPFEQQQFGTSGVERVKARLSQVEDNRQQKLFICSDRLALLCVVPTNKPHGDTSRLTNAAQLSIRQKVKRDTGGKSHNKENSRGERYAANTTFTY